MLINMAEKKEDIRVARRSRNDLIDQDESKPTVARRSRNK
jgi:hypothetical protein